MRCRDQEAEMDGDT